MAEGYTKIQNKILEAMIRYRFTGAQYTVLLYVLRKTSGWHNPTAKISISAISKESGYSRREIINSVNLLVDKKILKTTRNSTRSISEMSVNDPKKWSEGVKSTSHVKCTSQEGVKSTSHNKEKKIVCSSASADSTQAEGESSDEYLEGDALMEYVRRHME